MMRVRKKTLDKATEATISQAATAGIPLAFDRYEDQVPACGFGRMGLDCKACTQGPCRITPFEATNGTTCGRDREGTVAASFLSIIADGAVANASFAGAEEKVAGTVFAAIAAANEGNASAEQLLARAVEVASAGFAMLPAGVDGAVKEIQTGIGAINPDRLNILLIGNVPATRAKAIATELASNPKVNVVGAAGGEAADVAVAANYGSQEALLVTTAIDGVVAGKACVSPGFLALAARQGVPVVDADKLDASQLMADAETHFRVNAGRSLAARYAPASATVGFGTAIFGGITADQWKGLVGSGIKGIALMGGCNNAAETQDAAIVRQTLELLKNDVLVIATGCAAVGLAKAGYMNPNRVSDFAGKGLQNFLARLSEAIGLSVPAVIEAGTCWEMPAAMGMAKLFQKELKLPLGASMPEVSRPAAWSTALAIAAQGVPTYVGPILPLDGGLETVNNLNAMLAAKGGALMGPGQMGTDPEAIVKLVMGIGGGQRAN